MNYRENIEKSEIEINNPKLLSVEYDAKIRKYIFSINYYRGKTQNLETKKYRPLSKYLYDDTSKYNLKKDILHKYGLRAANNIDLSLYVLLEQFDSNYNTNYASEYATGNFSPKLVYNFQKEKKYTHMNFYENIKLNRYIHELAEKQTTFAGAKIIKHKRLIPKAIILAALTIGISLFSKQSKNNSTKAEKQLVSIENTDLEKNISSRSNSNDNKNSNDINNIIMTDSPNTQKQNIISTNKEINTSDNNICEEIEEVTTLEELEEKGYIETSEIGLEFGLCDRISLKNQKLSKFPSSSFGKQSYISCDKLNYDNYKISEIVAFRQDEIVDRINLTTEEKYNIKTSDLFGMYGPDIEIAYNFYGYKGNKIYKDLGYLNLDKLFLISDKTKKELSKKYENEQKKEYTLATK